MKNQNERFIIIDNWFQKRANENEKQNYLYLKQQGLEIVLPEFKIGDEWLLLEKCESIYPYFTLTNTCFRWLYSSTVGKLHERKTDFYSRGIYKYMSPVEGSCLSGQQHINNVPYFSHVLDFIGKAESQFDVSISNASICDLRQYIMSMLNKWMNWKPREGFALLHGDWKISNMVYKERPLLVDLEHMRIGIPEMEVANFFVQLYGMRKESDKLVAPFLEEFFSCASITTLNYDLIRTLTIPLLLYLRYLYARAGRILFKETVFDTYPMAWEQYESILL